MIEVEQFKAGKSEKSPAGYTYFLPTEINQAWVWKD